MYYESPRFHIYMYLVRCINDVLDHIQVELFCLHNHNSILFSTYLGYIQSCGRTGLFASLRVIDDWQTNQSPEIHLYPITSIHTNDTMPRSHSRDRRRAKISALGYIQVKSRVTTCMSQVHTYQDTSRAASYQVYTLGLIYICMYVGQGHTQAISRSIARSVGWWAIHTATESVEHYLPTYYYFHGCIMVTIKADYCRLEYQEPTLGRQVGICIDTNLVTSTQPLHTHFFNLRTNSSAVTRCDSLRRCERPG